MFHLLNCRKKKNFGIIWCCSYILNSVGQIKCYINSKLNTIFLNNGSLCEKIIHTGSNISLGSNFETVFVMGNI